MDREALAALADRAGIEPEYWDIRGQRHEITDGTKLTLLRIMGLSVADEGDLRWVLTEWDDAIWLRGIQPVLVKTGGDAPIEVDLHWPVEELERTVVWTLQEEGGIRHQDRFVPAGLEVVAERTVRGRPFVRLRLRIRVNTALGYHTLWMAPEDASNGTYDDPPASASERRPNSAAESVQSMRLIVAPTACYIPPGMNDEDRVWGPAVQLYALRSVRNWGAGDFSDLTALLELAAEQGAGMVGLNPLHALFPHDHTRRSPYSPSSRRFLNTFYIDVEAVPEFKECETARRLVGEPRFQAQLLSLREAEFVDFAAVWGGKRSVLERLYEEFRNRHLANGTARAEAFRAYQVRGGHRLWQHAVYEALSEHLHAKDPHLWGWPVWPEPYRDPDGAAVLAFAQEKHTRVEFFQYLQWVAQEQFAGAGRRSLDLGLKVGLYEDLAIGVDIGGLDTWLDQSLYALDARIGAPADDFNPEGQEWGLPPMIPHRLRAAAYQPFIEVLRANMQHGGVLRIDHVMGLMRLFWVPAGEKPTHGAYVRYALSDLLAVLALESQRNHCMVVGEDLGTVDDRVRGAMGPAQIHAYRVFYFTKGEDGAFRLPEDYPSQALVTVSTHDLPTLPGYWKGRDIHVRGELDLYPDPATEEEQVLTRGQDRTRIMVSLSKAGLLPKGIGLDAALLPDLPDSLIQAIHAYLARTPSRMMTFQFEDVIGQLDQVNFPGTVDEHPNWCRKLPIILEAIGEDPRWTGLTEVLRRERGMGRVAANRKDQVQRTGPDALVPRATYRLQMNRRFTFDDAARLVPYLKRLGISHCYLSPVLKARPGSLHGYDIIDHNELNPEIGGRGAFDHLVHVLHQHHMGLILDMVPNHMGIGWDNPWWYNVLENGPASPYADFFDIDWQPVKPELHGKVLLPVLEDHYGLVLERGLLKVIFDAGTGEFTLGYHEHRFPLDPQTYPTLLTHGIERLQQELGAEDPNLHELQTLIDALTNLPDRHETESEKIAVRLRDQEVLKRQLVRICAVNESIRRFVHAVVEAFNGREGHPGSFDRLDALLARQAYRLAFWRVASDEINYRRFFDINDLAGLSMDNPEVFDRTHRLVMEWISQGQVQGLRIDHPDGLRDPLDYCRRLQEAARVARGPRGGRRNLNPTSGGDDPSGEPEAIYIALEKILIGDEQLPQDWPVHGTTGYEYAYAATGMLVDQSAEAALERIYNRFVGRKTEFTELLYRCKKMIVHGPLASELNVLATDLNRIAESDRHTRDFTLSRIKEALAEVVACFPVYRTYVTGRGVSREDRRYVDQAIAEARMRSQAIDVSIYDFIARMLLLDFAERTPESVRSSATRFAMSFQQYTGPVMAKGMEDTAFYVFYRLLSLNDVGSDPTRFGRSVAEFHDRNRERAQGRPHALLSNSTHDHKRSADVRARINVLSEVPDRWQVCVSGWNRMNRSHKRRVAGLFAPTKNDEYAFYQTLIGAYPAGDLTGAHIDTFRERIERTMIKSVREAKVHSSWININPAYEDATLSFVRAVLSDEREDGFLADFRRFQSKVSFFGMLNGLVLTLLQLTAPGVPDIYQGDELWRYSLVDPDNRRPVDFELRQRMLRELDLQQREPSLPQDESTDGSEADAGSVQALARTRELFASLSDGRAKLYVISRVLRLRAQLPELFGSSEYEALPVRGSLADHACAYLRRHEERAVIVIVPRLCAKLLDFTPGRLPVGEEVWGDTWIELAESEAGRVFRHVLTRETLEPGRDDQSGRIPMGMALRSIPVGLFLCE